MSQILNTETKIVGSGRTDAGVHALGQTFHFDVKEQIKNLGKFKYSLNSILPEDIFISSIKRASDDFHARYNVKEKTYIYYLNMGEYDLFSRHYQTQFRRELDVKKMKEVIKVFEGKHCFQNFTTKKEDQDGFIRTIKSAKISQKGKLLKFTFIGDGFMRYMVRLIVGTLIEVGLGKINKNDVEKLLNSSERNIVSWKANPEGLYLAKVKY